MIVWCINAINITPNDNIRHNIYALLIFTLSFFSFEGLGTDFLSFVQRSRNIRWQWTINRISNMIDDIWCCADLYQNISQLSKKADIL